MSDGKGLDVEAQRRHFPGLARQGNGGPAVFLDGPAGSQVPQGVIDRVADCLAYHNANDGGSFATSAEVGAMVAEARQAVADLIGAADADEIVFGPNMTTLTFALSRSLGRTWSAGDEVVVTCLDHDANVTPWVLAARDAGAVVRYLDIDPADCTLRLDRLEDLLSPKTRLVAVGVASNAVGTIHPVAHMVAAAHRVGALVFLDAVHGVPHLPAEVQRWGADFLACSAYKFFGPHQGILWGRRELLVRLPAYKVRPAPETLPGRWMTGTPSFEAITGVRAAVDYLTDLGRQSAATPPADRRTALLAAYAAIRQHESALAAHFLTGLARLPGWRVWGITDLDRLSERVSTFGLTHEHQEPRQMAQDLGKRGIFTWSGDFYAPGLMEALGLTPGGMLRVGMLHYNTHAEVDRLLATLRDLGGSFSER